MNKPNYLKYNPSQAHSIEHDLFKEWMEWLQSNHPEHGFMYDGIISQEDWIKAPKHVLILLKDYNEKGHRRPFSKINLNDREDIRQNIFNLRHHLQKSICAPKEWRTWNNAARWVYGLMNSSLGAYPPFSEADCQGDAKHRSTNLKRVAVVDVKKKPGNASCSKSDLYKYFDEYPESYSYLARQISLYGKLDFIVCCGDGLFDIFKIIMGNVLLKEQYRPYAISKDNYLITRNGTIIIKYIHPLLLNKNHHKQDAYIRLMETAQEALKDLKNS